jgi:HPt (histidine-containing phosphotransfer) domain-containing protein
LLEIVSRWLGKSANLEIGLNKEIKIENPLFDLSQIEHIARGDQDFINKMIALFTEELPMSLKNLSDAYLAEDFEKISKIAHHIKPSIENIGIVTLIEEVREIEKFSEEYGKSERLEYLLNKLDKVLNQVIAVLKKDI